MPELFKNGASLVASNGFEVVTQDAGADSPAGWLGSSWGGSDAGGSGDGGLRRPGGGASSLAISSTGARNKEPAGPMSGLVSSFGLRIHGLGVSLTGGEAAGPGFDCI